MNNNFDINNSNDFESIVNKTQNGRIPFIGESFQELYRGQSKDSYILKSGISRYADSVKELKELEKNVLNDFKILIEKSPIGSRMIQLNHKDPYFENDWRWIEQIQHYRIPTRLLDWSLDPKIALFFAVESNEKEVGQFWVFKSPLTWSCDDHFEYNPYSDQIDIISNSSFYVEEDYKDKVAEQRRSFQSGKFTFQDCRKTMIALESQDELKEKMIKYTINPKAKNELLEYLLKFNIEEKTIYVEYDDEIESLVKEIKDKYNFR